MSESLTKDLPANYVCFYRFAAGEFEDEEVFYCIARVAKAENRNHFEVEKEFTEKLRYIKNPENRQHPFETWGPQELADRLNAYRDVEVDA